MPALLATLGSCGSSSSGSSSEAPAPSAAFASLVVTDAVDDELEVFEVDVTRVVLERVGAADVPIVESSVRVDFRSLATLAQLLESREVPTGVYSGVRVRFDFQTASVYLRDKSSAASLVDGNGSPLTGTLEVPIEFATNSRPEVVAGRNHTFEIDLDLEQALTIDRPANRVGFAPVLRASFDPATPKPTSMGGVLLSVDLTQSRFVLESRSPADDPQARVEVQASARTIFTIEGRSAQGLTSMPSLTALTLGSARITVQGELDRETRRLHASAIAAGSGTIGNEQDYVRAWIMARSGGSGADATLTVYGSSRRANGTRSFNQSFTVLTSLANTRVVRAASSSVFTTDALQVGSSIEAFGELSGTTLDARASGGVVRALPTTLFGTANGSPSNNTLLLTLTRIGTRPIEEFNFSVASQNEADRNAYAISAGVLTLFGVTTGSKIEATGFPNAVGIPSDRDFEASATLNRSSAHMVMDARWSPARADALTTGGGTLTLDVSNASVKQLQDGFGGRTMNDSPAPTIASLPGGIFTLVIGNTSSVHQDFTTFVAAVQSALTGGAKLQRVSGLGTFEPTTQLYLTQLVSVILIEAN